MLLVAGACTADPGPPLECREACREASRLVYDRWSDPRSCSADDECELVTSNDVRCGGGALFGLCPEVVHRDSVGDYLDTVDGVADDVCPRVQEPCGGCAPSCIVGTARCVDGRCVDDSTLDAGAGGG